MVKSGRRLSNSLPLPEAVQKRTAPGPGVPGEQNVVHPVADNERAPGAAPNRS